MEKFINFIFETLFNQKAIFWAVEKNQISMLKFFIYIGMNTSITNADGQALLDFAIQKNNKEVVLILANLSTNHNTFDDILLRAARLGNADIVAYMLDILDKGASVNYLSNSGDMSIDTALDLAVRGGHKNVVDKLLEISKNKNSAIKNGNKALEIAVEKGYKDIVKTFLENYMIFDDNALFFAETLIFASKKGGADIVKIFIDNSGHIKDEAKTNILGEVLREALKTYRSEEGRVDIFNMLLDNYPSLLLYKPDPGLDGLLVLAVLSNEVNFVSDLVDRCKKLKELKEEDKLDFLTTESDTSGKNALMYAAERGNAGIVQVLIDAVGNLDKKQEFLNSVDKEGNTVLHWAAIGGSKDVIDRLFKAGAKLDLNLVNENGDTVLHSASRRGREDVVSYLIAKCDELGPELKKEFLEKKNEQGVTALYLANLNSYEKVSLILANASKPDASKADAKADASNKVVK